MLRAMQERRWTSTTKRAVVLVLLALALLVIWRIGEIVQPFMWAFVVGYILLPVVGLLERRTGIRRGFAAALVWTAMFAFLVGLIRVTAPLAITELRDLQRGLPTQIESAQLALAQIFTDLGMTDLGSVVLLQGTQELSQAAARLVVPVITTAGRFTLELLLFLIATFFVLRDAPRLFGLIRDLVPRAYRADVEHIARQVGALIQRYIRGQLLLVLIMSSVTTIGLTLLDVPYAVVLGFVTGWLELIPIVGPITAGAIATVVALGHPNPFGWSQLAYVAAVAVMYTVLRHAEDYFVIPFVIGRIVRLHPLVVIFSLLAGGAMLGLLGVILAVPAAAALRLVLVFVVARLRDEDPLARLEREIEEVQAQEAPAGQPVGEQVGP